MSVSLDLHDESGMDGQMSDRELTEELGASVSVIPKQRKTIPSGCPATPEFTLSWTGEDQDHRVDLALGILTTGH